MCFSLTETKRRLIVKSSQLFDSPLVAYEALKSGSSVTTIRHKSKVLKFLSLSIQKVIWDLLSVTWSSLCWSYTRPSHEICWLCGHLYYQINTCLFWLSHILFFQSESTGISNQPVFILKICLPIHFILCTPCLADGVQVWYLVCVWFSISLFSIQNHIIEVVPRRIWWT